MNLGRLVIVSLSAGLLLAPGNLGCGGGSGGSGSGESSAGVVDGTAGTVFVAGNALTDGSRVTAAVEGGGPSTVLDGDGAFELSGVSSGDVAVVFSSTAFGSRTIELVNVPEGAAVTLRDVRLTSRAAVAGAIEVSGEDLGASLEAEIVADPTSGSAPLLVQFSAALAGELVGVPLFAWDFGDGGSSSDAAPAHEYLVPASYVVTLAVTDDDIGVQAEASIAVTVEEPEAQPFEVEALASPGEGETPLIVLFDVDVRGDGGGALSYSWSFGDGGTSEEAQPTHTYETAGDFEAVVTVREGFDLSGADSITIRVLDPAEEAKATICHAPPGNPANAHTLTVGEPAVRAHLRHGDTEGACEDGEPGEPTEPTEPGDLDDIDDPDDGEEEGPGDGEIDDPDDDDGDDGGDEERVTICHRPPGNPDRGRTLTIGADGLQDHLDHGDSVGTCSD